MQNYKNRVKQDCFDVQASVDTRNIAAMFCLNIVSSVRSLTSHVQYCEDRNTFSRIDTSSPVFRYVGMHTHHFAQASC